MKVKSRVAEKRPGDPAICHAAFTLKGGPLSFTIRITHNDASITIAHTPFPPVTFSFPAAYNHTQPD